MKSIKCFVYGLLIVFILTSFQNKSVENKNRAKQILIQLKNHYRKNPNYWVEIEYAQFDNESKLIQKSLGFYKHYNEFEHNHQLGIETVLNQNGKILVDSSKKTIILQPYSNNFKIENSFDEFIDKCEDVSVIDSGKIIKISFLQNPEKTGIKHCALSIENDRIKQLEFVKRDPFSLKYFTLKISFFNYKNNKKIPKSETSLNQFFDNLTDKNTLQKKYLGYKIIGSFNK